MLARDFAEDIKELPEDCQLVLSEFIAVTDEFNDGMTAIVDIPIHGMAYNKETKELRFVVKKADVDVLAERMDIPIRPLE